MNAQNIVGLIALTVPMIASAECEWSPSFPILNEEVLQFQECKTESRIRIGEIEVQPNIEFEIVHAHYPAGNSIWSEHSPDGDTAVVWIENGRRERNVWVIDPQTNEVLLFSDESEGHHLAVEFDSNDRFRIIHAGMGYRTDHKYRRTEGNWRRTGREKNAAFDSGWIVSRDCSGPGLSLSVTFNETLIYQTRGPICRDQGTRTQLTFDFEPKQSLTWTGYREEPFDSPADAVLSVDLWLAGDDSARGFWTVGTTVRTPGMIYMNTVHMADLVADSETCIAPQLCIKTSGL